MVKESDLSAGKLIDRLYGIFSPIYARWNEWAPTELYLWGETRGKSDTKLLQEDIRSVGIYFAHADLIGARTEYTLTAECMARLRLIGNKQPITRAALEQEIDNACRTLEHELMSEHVKFDIVSSTELRFQTPVSWRVTQYMVGDGRCPPEALEEIYRVYHDFAHLFLLRDGNITPEEDIVWKNFYVAFNQ